MHEQIPVKRFARLRLTWVRQTTKNPFHEGETIMLTGDGLLTSAGYVEALLIVVCALVLISQGCFMLFLVRWLSGTWSNHKWRLHRRALDSDEIPWDEQDFSRAHEN